MKDTSFRTFTVPRADGRIPFKFAVHTLADGTVQVTRISPYDETEYHWATKSPGRNHCRIIRNGLAVSTVGPFIGGNGSAFGKPFTNIAASKYGGGFLFACLPACRAFESAGANDNQSHSASETGATCGACEQKKKRPEGRYQIELAIS